METEAMGRTVTEATIENLEDLYAANKGQLAADKIRRLTVNDALVDTGATLLSLPTRLIQELGLRPQVKKLVTTSSAVTEATMYHAARLTLQGRQCTMHV